MYNSGYWDNIKSAIETSIKGLKTTIRHFANARTSTKPLGVFDAAYFKQDKGLMTLQYPHESLPIPDNGRYKLHNEIDDCIVCDKCVKVCPVDCIDIEPIKSVETFGHTSDGTPKRIYAAKFDIDMGKCCFCGLCTTVCPTECLTMTKSFDFSEFDIKEHIFEFATMTPLEILEKKKAWEEHEKSKGRVEKESVQGFSTKSENKPSDEETNKPKPTFKPRPMIKKKKSDDE